jgi:hypothetical protein
MRLRPLLGPTLVLGIACMGAAHAAGHGGAGGCMAQRTADGAVVEVDALPDDEVDAAGATVAAVAGTAPTDQTDPTAGATMPSTTATTPSRLWARENRRTRRAVGIPKG